MAPAKRLEDMTPEERLQSLEDYAEEKKYVQPGQDGTLPWGIGAMNAMVSGGPLTLRTGGQPQYDAPLAPPSYESATGEASKDHGSEKHGPFKKWRERREEKRTEKQGHGDGNVSSEKSTNS